MLKACLVPKDQAPPLSTAVLFVDLASSTGKKSDDSVILAGKLDAQASVYVVDGRGDRWEPNQLALNVIDMTIKHRPLKVMFENVASCKYFVETLRMIATEKGVNIPIDYIKVDNNLNAKTIRVKGLSSNMTRGRLKFFSSLPCWEKTKTQFVNFSGSKNEHDDYPDTVALMVNFFGGNVPPPQPAASRNKMIAMLQRDVQAEQIMFQENSFSGTEGDMGSDFAC